MRSEREPLFAALAGFLVGVLFTLVVVQFSSFTGWFYRLVILSTLTILAAATTTVFLFLQRRPASEAGKASFQEAWKNVSPPIEPNPAAMPVPQANVATAPPERGDRRSGGPGGTFPPRGENLRTVEPSSSFPQGRPKVDTFETPLAKRRDNDSVWYPDEQELPIQPVPARASSSIVADPGRLVDVWEIYRTRGDGKFTAQGLRQRLEAAGIAAEVLPGEHVGAGDNLLGIDFRGGGLLYLLPNFNKPARAVSQWFQPLGSESRTAVIQRLIRPATARRSGGGLTVETKGEIE